MVRFGSLCVVEESDLGDAAILSGVGLRKFEGFHEDIVKCLNDEPFISDVNKDIPEEEATILLIRNDETEGYAPLYMGGIGCTVHLPRKNQRVPDTYSGDVIENFRIEYAGTAFVCYGPEPESAGVFLGEGLMSYDWQFAKEAAMVLRNALGKSSRWKVADVGPTPIHPCFHIEVVRDSAAESVSLQTNREFPHEIEVVARLPESVDEATFLRHLLRGAVHIVGLFYAANLLRHQTIDTFQEIIQHQRTAGALYSELGEIRWWQVWAVKRYALVSNLRKSIAAAYSQYVQLTTLQGGVSQQADLVCDLAREDELLREAVPYFRDHLLENPAWEIDAILRSLQFFEEESRSMGIQRATVEAALIWAVTGGVIVWLLTEIFG